MTGATIGAAPVTKPTLKEFAQDNPGPGTGIQAWLPSIPEFTAICEAWNSGAATQNQIRNWLIQVQGYSPKECTHSKIAWLTIYMPKRQNG